MHRLQAWKLFDFSFVLLSFGDFVYKVWISPQRSSMPSSDEEWKRAAQREADLLGLLDCKDSEEYRKIIQAGREANARMEAARAASTDAAARPEAKAARKVPRDDEPQQTPEGMEDVARAKRVAALGESLNPGDSRYV